MKTRTIGALLVLATCLCHFAFTERLSAQEPFYKGKSIRLVVGSTPG